MRFGIGLAAGLIAGALITELKTDLPIYLHAGTNDFAALARCISTGP